MARHRSSKATVLGATAGAFLALAAAPPAHADFDFDDLIDPSAFAAAISAIDPSFMSEMQQLNVWLEDNWMNTALGAQIDNQINAWAVAGGAQPIIGDGTAGTFDDPEGGPGGLLFGNGGNGFSYAEGSGFHNGGDGGDASYFGNGGNGGDGSDGGAGGTGGNGGLFYGNGGHGGNGGDGVAGALGGNGGDGGSATGAFGIGGDGGNGGDGGSSGDLPALGGAGGNGSMLGGAHGAVGDPGTLAGGSPSPSPSPIDTTGSWITNSDGQVVLLHGLNEVYKVAPFEPSASGFDAQDAQFLEDNGFNAVRLGVIWAGVEPTPGYFDPDYLASIAQTVNILHDHGIVAILDFHQDAYSGAFGGEGAPAWAVQDGGLPNPTLGFPLNIFFNPAEQQAWESFWTNADGPNGVGLENNYAQMLEHVASYLHGNPGVGGYEIMNEPSPGISTFYSTIFGNSFFDSQQLTPFYDQAASAIRAVDPNTPVFFEPNVLSNAGIPTSLGTVDASNTVLSFHDYCEFDLGSLGCLPSVSGVVGNAETYAQAHHIPAFMTEYGATSNQTQLAAPMQGANQNLLGWTEWAYSSKGDITTSASPPGSESLVYDPSQSPVGDNVNTANLATLAQPYPQVVSGTPNSFSFENGTFQFSYSTERVDGSGDFTVGSQTTISVPAVEFPNGYTVAVTGGHVTSGADAPELVIVQDAGATTVSVTVSPAS